MIYVWLLAMMQSAAPPPAGPVQPVPYSHKTHLALGLKCNNCHANPDPGEVMGFPPEAKCMQCHSAVKADSPHIQKLASFAKEGKKMPWVRVYHIPGFVFFSHRAHTAQGFDCAKCHGAVAERDVLRKEINHSMGDCMECHRHNKASTDCKFCHDERN